MLKDDAVHGAEGVAAMLLSPCRASAAVLLLFPCRASHLPIRGCMASSQLCIQAASGRTPNLANAHSMLDSSCRVQSSGRYSEQHSMEANKPPKESGDKQQLYIHIH